ncbi:MAG: T9SS type A sorting domain-containing protein [PVC group bacterium]|nr:T9SS type A sorting domain-containing protein [PVC group bacterium]
MARFDGASWTVYDTSNSSLPANTINSLVIDGNGEMWMVAFEPFGYYRLVKYDGVDFKVFTNMHIPGYITSRIAIERNDLIWIGIEEGLIKFDGTNSVKFNNKSGLPFLYDNVYTVTIDNSGNKWLGGKGGNLAVFNEGGVVEIKSELSHSKSKQNCVISLKYSYPITLISFTVRKKGNISLNLFNLMGRNIKTIIKDFKKEGTYQVNLNCANLSSGMYLVCLRSDSNGMVTKKLVLRR